MNIKNIIFDLGGVLLNINYHLTIDAFKKLGVRNFDAFFTQARQTQLFDRLDKGEVSPEDFREELREISNLPLKDNEIDKAWNAMLLDFPKKKIQLLQQVQKNYRTFLLSNTNAIHYPAYTRTLKRVHDIDSLKDLFEQQYLSHEVGMRKPDTEIYKHVLDQNQLEAEETLFFDDTLQHVEGAGKAGLYAWWIDLSKEDVTGYFDQGKLKESFLGNLKK